MTLSAFSQKTPIQSSSSIYYSLFSKEFNFASILSNNKIPLIVPCVTSTRPLFTFAYLQPIHTQEAGYTPHLYARSRISLSQYSISISTNGRPLWADRFASVPDQREYTSHCWLFITIKILRQLTGKIPPTNDTGIDSNKTQRYHTYNTTQHSEVRRVSVGCSLVPFHHMVWITFRIINPLIKTYQNRFFGQGPCSLSHNVPSSPTDRCLTYSLSRTPPGLFWTSASH